MATELPPELRGCFHAPSEEQRAVGWSQDWPQHWAAHDALLAAGGRPPTAEQLARGWTQDWDAWKSAQDQAVEGGRIVSVDFTGGAAVRAAKAQASKETAAWQAEQLKGARGTGGGVLRCQLCLVACRAVALLLCCCCCRAVALLSCCCSALTQTCVHAPQSCVTSRPAVCRRPRRCPSSRPCC